MRPAPDYRGPVWITVGERQLAFLDRLERRDGAELGIVYPEGEVPGRGAFLIVPVEQLEVPPVDQIAVLEDRLLMMSALRK